MMEDCTLVMVTSWWLCEQIKISFGAVGEVNIGHDTVQRRGILNLHLEDLPVISIPALVPVPAIVVVPLLCLRQTVFCGRIDAAKKTG